MDDVEIVVGRRKGVDERKALKLLSKFLKRDEEKDPDDQLPSDVQHQLQQVRDSLEGKEPAGVGLLGALSSPLSADGGAAAPSSPPAQNGKVKAAAESHGAGDGSEQQEQEAEEAAQATSAEKKHKKKKRHKKD